MASLDQALEALRQSPPDAILVRSPDADALERLLRWPALSQAVLDSALVVAAPEPAVGPALKLLQRGAQDVLNNATLRNESLEIRTSAAASPTGFPFKVAQVAGTVAEPAVYQARRRVCDMGVLREIYQKPDGSVGYRCASEPVDDYVAKGGDAADCEGRLCLCNALCASAGVPQVRNGEEEACLVTLGDDLAEIRGLLGDRDEYTAEDVIRHLRG